MNDTDDLLGRPMTADEKELLDLYRRLQQLAAREDLAPCARMNVKQAMVMLWNCCVDLDLLFEEPDSD